MPCSPIRGNLLSLRNIKKKDSLRIPIHLTVVTPSERFTALTHRLEIRLQNEFSEIPRALDAIDSFFDGACADGAARFDVSMSLEELISNIIRHGYPEGTSGEIRLNMSRRGNAIHCELIDHGKPFDPLSLPTPDIKADIDDRPIGGLGIHLVRETMQEVRYQRIDGQNVLHLVRCLRADPG